MWGKGRTRALFCTFRGPCWRERLLSFINGSDSRKPSLRGEIKQLRVGSEGCSGAVERGSRAPSRRGNAEPRGCRGRGAAVWEQRSGAITFFLLLFQVNTLPRPPLAPSTPPPSLSAPLMCFYLRAAVQTNMIGIYSPLLTFSSSL